MQEQRVFVLNFTKMKEIIRILGQYINNNNDPIVEAIYYRLCKFYYK